MPAVQSQAQQFDFYKYLRILWRRKWLLVVPLLICVPVAIIAAVNYPTEYASRAVLELQSQGPAFETGRIRIHVTHELQGARMVMLGWNSIRDVVMSRKIDFGMDIDPDNRRQIEKLYHQISRRTRMGGLGARHMFVSHTSTNPERNASLVNELVKRFVSEDKRKAQEDAKQDLKYYNEKLAVARAHLGEVDNQLREFVQANSWLGDDLSKLNEDYEESQQRELTVRGEISEVEALLDNLKKALAKEQPEIVQTREAELPKEVKDARKRVAILEEQFRHVNLRYTPAARQWQGVKRELDFAVARLKEIDQGQDAIEETIPNPKYEALKNKLAETQKRRERLDQRRLAENKKVSDLYVKVRRAPELLAQKGGLLSSRNGALANVNDYVKGARAADKALQRLMTEAYSNRFTVLEYARDDRTPLKSTKMKIMALGLMLGLMLGVGLIALIEYLDQTFKTIDDARECLGIAALGVVPAIFTPRDHRRRLWFRVLAVSSAVFVVGVGVAIYLMVPATQDYLNQAWVWFQEQMERW